MSYVLFISEQKLKDSTAINLNVDVDILLPFVREAQKLYVETALGTQLTQKLKNEIIAGTLAGAYKTLVDEYIGDMLPGYSLYHAIPYLRHKVENGNIYNKSSETGSALTTAEAQSFREEVLNTASYYRERLIDYIKNNISSFPEYNQNSGADVSPSTENYYSNMNLDMPRQSNKLTLRDFLTPDLT
tara:strand:- start:6504 stop:7064 length:561 start_codon:yes stop_codon:yes gene_type:complete